MYLIRIVLSISLLLAINIELFAQYRCERQVYHRVCDLPPAPPPIEEMADDDIVRQPIAPESRIRERQGRPDGDNENWNLGKTVEVTLVQQVDVNANSFHGNCGQYMLACLQAALGMEVDQAAYDEIGRSVNPKGKGVWSNKLIGYLRSKLECRRHRPGSFELLKEHIDQGMPALLIVEREDTRHWILVTGYTTNGNSEFAFWRIVDNGVLSGQLAHAKLDEIWRKADNYCLLVGPSGKYPAGLNEKLAQITLERNNPWPPIPKPVVRPQPVEHVVVESKNETPPEPVRTKVKPAPVVNTTRKPEHKSIREVLSKHDSRPQSKSVGKFEEVQKVEGIATAKRFMLAVGGAALVLGLSFHVSRH